MVAFAKRCLPFGLLAAASAWIAFANTATGDYPQDGGLAVHLLAAGDVSGYLQTHVMMGPFATLVQAPFAALGGNQGLAAYQWACLPCLFAVGLLGLYLARIARQRQLPLLGSGLIAALCLVNPLTFAAIELGHPEELLTAALAIGAVAVAAQGHGGRAALLLGLAIASKQWAVVAILPVMMALPQRRLRAALIATGVVVALFLPGFLAAPGSFFEAQHHAASTGAVVDPWSVWYPLGSVTTIESTIGGVAYSTDIHRAPDVVGSLSHPLIVLLVFALPLGLALRRRSFSLAGAEAMALLSLLALLRCALDPVSNLYYHLPLLLALAAWDAFDSNRWPLRLIVGTAFAVLFDYWSRHLTDAVAFNAAYVLVAASATLLVAVSLFRRGGEERAAASLDARLSLVS